jgi:uncharacterized protein (TIGR00251 family)
LPACRRDGDDLVLEVRVQPRASRSEIAGLHGERLRIRLQAPPVDGKANAALVEFVAGLFAIPRARVTIEHGLTGRDKRLRLHGVPSLPAPLESLLGRA